MLEGNGPVRELGAENREPVASAALELAWGVVGVNRVASETLRGVAFIGICVWVSVGVCVCRQVVNVAGE